MCPGFGGCGAVEKAPPEFLEDRFCELRLYGVLGSTYSPGLMLQVPAEHSVWFEVALGVFAKVAHSRTRAEALRRGK
jgi:hypothetical protein